MGELPEVNRSANPLSLDAVSAVITAPPFQLNSPSCTPEFVIPLASPMKKAIAGVQGYLHEAGHFTQLDPHDAWLPITESRSGNWYYSAFHLLSSGIGVQALLLPLAFTVLGWCWGVLCLSVAFVWQMYTLWLLTQLHESESGTRYSRYLQLCMAAFGEKLGKLLALFPTIYLSTGTCIALTIMGGGSMKIFFQIACGTQCNANLLTAAQWYLVFACSVVLLAQLPNLNSVAGVSLIGALSAMCYCTLIWAVPVSKDRPMGVSYQPIKSNSDMARLCDILNAIGVIVFVFRGHNLVLEIQLPNLNSVAGVSLIGALSAMCYCTLIWAVPVSKDRPMGVSYQPIKSNSDMARLCDILNAIGVIVFVFRGHNLVLEIQLPNLNSVAGVSLIGALSAMCYCTLIWAVPVSKDRPMGVSYQPIKSNSDMARLCDILNAIGVIVFVFRGHNLVLEIQITTNGLLDALHKYHGHETSRVLLGFISLLIIFNIFTSFQIYAMPVFDNLESRYTHKMNKPCPRWLRAGIRVFFGFYVFFISVALPFLPSLAGLMGGIALPVTLAYPCFMFIILRKPKTYSTIWCLNWGLGWFGMVLSVLLAMSAIWKIVTEGIEIHFFKPNKPVP